MAGAHHVPFLSKLVAACTFALAHAVSGDAWGADASVAPQKHPLQLGSLSPSQCRSELARRRIETKPARSAAPGVATPLRLSRSLQGVRFRTPGGNSVYGILDCRLLLALDEFARALVDVDVVEVHVDNFYRPHAHLPGRRDKPSQHSYGLAADIEAFTLRDGTVLRVEQDWTPELGEPPCGETAEGTTGRGVVLRKIVCDTLALGIFQHVLTPNTDAAHRNHLHFDIARSKMKARPSRVKRRPSTRSP